ncbi:helix-turn-helix domain-containing protein [Seohaeicola saemankumensis]|uniref:Helix-turn-helix domain-containing protein n=1 Tax=Seohaeicola saemankumensis TaxID=481181 RepID=A0ABW3TB77_9RHOB
MSHHVDVHVGKRIRHRRWLLAMTQQQLAEQVGIKFQQIQKYETGANRVSASRLWDIADSLGVPVSFFFEGLANAQGELAPVTPHGAHLPRSILPDADGAGSKDLMGDREAMDLVRTYYAIPENQRRRLFDLARVLSDAA